MAPALLQSHSSVIVGSLAAATGGLVNGLFAFPMRWHKRWTWENYWLPFSFLALGLFPLLTLYFTSSHLGETIHRISTGDLVVGVVCGVLTYTGSLLFGLAIDLIGAALAFSLLIGCMSIVGTIIPIMLLHRGALSSSAAHLFEIGGCFFLLAIWLNFRAGWLRESASERSHSNRRFSGAGARGMGLAALGGMLSGCLSLGMDLPWAHHVSSAAAATGLAGELHGVNLGLSIVLLGGLLPNCLYACLRMLRQGTSHNYMLSGTGKGALAVLVMAVLYYASLILWGIGISANNLGSLGPSVGWGIFVGAIVISSTAGGVLLGEWKAVPKAYPWLAGALTSTIAAVVLVAMANLK